MSVKDVYGKKVSEQNHMVFAHNPTSMLLNELKRKKMSDREIMDAKGYGNPNRDSWQYSDTKVKKQELPDARKHQIISFIKSGIRILGYSLLVVNLPIAVCVLVFSEVIGIIEELV